MKKTKLISAAAALLLSGGLLLNSAADTAAWQSTDQTALNEAYQPINPGGRLHDDFDGRNKDIYVENFADEPIYARILIKEYLEIGDDAGKLDESGRNVDIITRAELDNPADAKNISTWPVHHYTADDDTAPYWTWTLGGNTVFMPTFNMNKDSAEAAINGTLEGLDDRADEGEPYDDYVKWTVGQNSTGAELRDADLNDYDEFGNGEGFEGVNYTLSPMVTHTAQETAFAEVIRMADWERLTLDEKTRANYWVIDEDGWAYYSKGIPPQSASGLLLSSVEPTAQLDSQRYYYAIHVIAEFVTKNDIGTPEDGGGFYADGSGPSDKALAFLREIGAVSGGEAEQAAAQAEPLEEESEAPVPELYTVPAEGEENSFAKGSSHVIDLSQVAPGGTFSLWADTLGAPLDMDSGVSIDGNTDGSVLSIAEDTELASFIIAVENEQQEIVLAGIYIQ